MCLIVLAWQPEQDLSLVVAANRDEFHSRPSLPLVPWTDSPGLIAGRDLQAGGTWMGVTLDGRFAALTNIRRPGQAQGLRSRGELPEQYLRGQLSPEDYLCRLQARRGDYAGFNLLLGDQYSLWHLNSEEGLARPLAPGVYGLSNASLDTPWPKLQRAKTALTRCLPAPSLDDLLQLLADRQRPDDQELPDTGVPLDMERLLSSAFIASPDYGTRASTALIRHTDGALEICERRFGPDGPLGDTFFRYP